MTNKYMRVGVLIGRFQTPYLHEGHIALLDEVSKQCDWMVVFIGTTVTKNTKNNPMDYETRELMLESALEDYGDKHIVLPLADTNSDEAWSQSIDSKLEEVLQWLGEYTVTLYGARDSFVPHYKGSHKAIQLDIDVENKSSTAIRNSITVDSSSSFREGVIYASRMRYPAVFPTVDIAILNGSQTKLLLGRKPNNAKWCFPGGFVDPTDESLKHAAVRELKEETGIEIQPSELTYVDSMLVNDYRYRGEVDKIMTTLFVGYVSMIDNTPVAGDDLEEVKWFDIYSDLSGILVDEHLTIYSVLKKRLNIL